MSTVTPSSGSCGCVSLRCLLGVFLTAFGGAPQRDELRKILRANNMSYHRHANPRMMMSKTEMADQLHGIIRSQSPPNYGLARQDGRDTVALDHQGGVV